MNFDRRVIAASFAVLSLLSVPAFADDAKPAAAAPAATAAAAAAAPAASAPAAPAAAAPAPTAQVPDAVKAWAKFCDPDPKDGHLICNVRQLAFNGNSIEGSVVITLNPTKNGAPVVTAAVPVGIVLTTGLKWQIDKGRTMTSGFWHCTPQTCESVVSLKKSDFLKRMRNGSTLTLTAKNVVGKDFVVTFNLKGFAAAYDMKNAPTYADYTKSLPH